MILQFYKVIIVSYFIYTVGTGLSAVFWKAPLPIAVRVPNDTLVRLIQLTNAFAKIVVTLGATTLVKSVQFAQLPSPMIVTLEGSDNDDNLLHPSNV